MSEQSEPNVTERETDLWDGYLAGELTPAETAELHRTAEARGNDVRLLAAVAALFHTRPRVDVSRLWLDQLHIRLERGGCAEPMAARAREVSTDARRTVLSMRHRGTRLSLTGVAIAAVVLAVVVGIRFASTAWRTPSAARVATYATTPGERATIKLVDGTIVSLNVASKLEIPQDFGGRERRVRLQGQADFRVAHHAGAPFTVDAGGTRTVVLGTEFGVRAYDPGSVQVAVRTGRVAVQSVVLGARDIATVTSRHVTVARDQDLDAALGFTSGRLVLNNVPLRDALPDLERWYDVKIQFRDSTVGDIPVHAALTNGSVGDLMEALRVTLGVRVVCVGRTLTLDRE